MRKSPLISIIIPTFNDKDVVCDAIDSSLTQTYNPVEVIVIDDGSSDGTGTQLKDRYGSRIRYIYQDNRGLAGARNAGIRIASGKYLQFLDADDVIHCDKISCLYEALKNASYLALAYCDYRRTNLHDGSEYPFQRMSPVLQEERQFHDLMMKWETKVSIPHHCFLFSTNIFHEYNISYDEELPNHEDWACLMDIFALKPDIIYIDKVLANYRFRRESMCTNRMLMRIGYLMAIEKQIEKRMKDVEIARKLKLRAKQIRYLYRDESRFAEILERCHPTIKKYYVNHVPFRIHRLLD
jgi:glycosyltransferase involved in cell wall biosynthesis